MKKTSTLMIIDNFHPVSLDVVRQTIEESKITHSIDMGAFVVHHGTRDKRPIVIVEHKNQQEDELSGIWFSES